MYLKIRKNEYVLSLPNNCLEYSKLQNYTGKVKNVLITEKEQNQNPKIKWNYMYIFLSGYKFF